MRCNFSAGRVPKFNLKVYTFVYDMLVYFPNSGIQYETFTTDLFFLLMFILNYNENSFASFTYNW